MKEEKMHLINKIFQDETIRTIWDSEEEKYYVSVVDIVRIMTKSKDSQAYWRKLKQRLREEGNETVTNCHGLKLKSKDGKYRMTDVCDIEGMFRIIESVPSKKAEPIKLFLARLGKERIDETFNPSIAIQRAIDIYRTKGYDEDWIAKRIKILQERKKLTDIWQENGIDSNIEYAILTNEIYKGWSEMTAKEYKKFKGLRKESLRDNMTDLEVLLTDIGEVTTRELAKKHKPYGLDANIKIAQDGGEIAKNTRADIEKRLGEVILSKENNLNYQYTGKDKQIENKSSKYRKTTKI